MKYEIVLTEAEDKALAFVALDQNDWIQNAVHERCRVAIEDIIRIAVDKSIETNTVLPTSREDIAILAFERGWVKTSVERQAESELAARMPQQEAE